MMNLYSHVPDVVLYDNIFTGQDRTDLLELFRPLETSELMLLVPGDVIWFNTAFTYGKDKEKIAGFASSKIVTCVTDDDHVSVEVQGKFIQGAFTAAFNEQKHLFTTDDLPQIILIAANEWQTTAFTMPREYLQ